MPFHDEIEHHAAVSPHKIAFVAETGVRSYGDLASRSKLFTSYIMSLPGSRRGQSFLSDVNNVVALDIGNHIVFPELFAGSTCEGNACVILDPKMTEDQIEEVLIRLRPNLLVTRSLFSCSAQVGLRIGLDVKDIASLDYFESGSRPADVKVPSGSNTDTFLVCFTSGTTSHPKAFSRSRASWRKSLSLGLSLFGLKDGPSTMCPGNIAHGLGLYVLAETLHSGGTFYALDWQADIVSDALRSGNVQRFVSIPAVMHGLSENNRLKQLDGFPHVREVVTTGSKLDRKQVSLTRDMFPNARVMEYYGASELGFISVSQVFPIEPSSSIETVGRPFPGVEITIRSSSGKMLGCGETGTIYVQSEQICDGYLWGDDDRSFRLGAVGAATVGDIGEVDIHGALTLRGRAGGMVIVNGHNVYPSEVEAALRSIDGIDEVVVLGVADDYLGMRLVAVLSGDLIDLPRIHEDATKILPTYKLPSEFFRTNSWPMTRTGKVARAKVTKAVEKGEYSTITVSDLSDGGPR